MLDKYKIIDRKRYTFSPDVKVKYFPPNEFILEVEEYTLGGYAFRASNWWLMNSVTHKGWEYVIQYSKKVE